MFEKSRILLHFTKYEDRADLTKAEMEELNKVIVAAKLMDKAIEKTRETNDTRVGAFWLSLCLADISTMLSAPSQLSTPVTKLLCVVIEEIRCYEQDNIVVGKMLLTSALGIMTELSKKNK